jgi:RNA polymerase sigma-70 factor (ECF subfamily)
LEATAPGTALAGCLEGALQRAQPRLTRIARSYGIAADEAEDVVQETRIRAWRHLAQVRSAARFDAWLDAICRNQCRMYLRAQQAARRYITSPSLYASQRPQHTAGLSLDGECIGAALAPDPYEEVERRELAEVLERAMQGLPAHAREALELRYQQGYSLAEIASALNTSLVAQEARLRRARGQLRELLLGSPRYESVAREVDLASAEGEPDGAWKTTRITCYLCGRRPLEGRFEPFPSRHRELRLRCPACSPQHGIDIFRSKGLAVLDDLRMFRPALMRSMRALALRAERALAAGHDTCLHCGAPVQRRLVTSDAFPAALSPTLQRHWLVASCPRAGCPGLGAWAALDPVLWSTAAARDFMARHPRWVLAPEEATVWQGCSAIRVLLDDRSSAARLTLVVARETLRVLAAFEA